MPSPSVLAGAECPVSKTARDLGSFMSPWKWHLLPAQLAPAASVMGHCKVCRALSPYQPKSSCPASHAFLEAVLPSPKLSYKGTNTTKEKTKQVLIALFNEVPGLTEKIYFLQRRLWQKHCCSMSICLLSLLSATCEQLARENVPESSGVLLPCGWETPVNQGRSFWPFFFSCMSS